MNNYSYVKFIFKCLNNLSAGEGVYHRAGGRVDDLDPPGAAVTGDLPVAAEGYRHAPQDIVELQSFVCGSDTFVFFVIVLIEMRLYADYEIIIVYA